MTLRSPRFFSSPSRALAAFALSIALIPGPGAQAGSAEWSTSFIDARTAATTEKKDLLLLFTGSDWCPPCIALEEEILDDPAFDDPANAAFVPVLLDFPSDKPQPDATRRQNTMLQSRYQIQGYPTLLLTDATGQVYATAGYEPDLAQRGPAAYAAHLMQLRSIRRARDTAFAEAQAAEGLDRARALDRGLEAVGPELAAAFYTNVLNDVVALDPDDEAGLRSKYQRLLSMQYLDQELAAAVERLQSGELRGGLDDLAAIIDTYRPHGEKLQTVEFVRAQAHDLLGEPAEARAAFERSIKAAPASPAVRDIRQEMGRSAEVAAETGAAQ